MNRKEFLRRLDELLELEPGALTGAERLADLPRWDSLAALGFIALLDRALDLRVPASALAECKTVDDLLRLGGNKLSP